MELRNIFDKIKFYNLWKYYYIYNDSKILKQFELFMLNINIKLTNKELRIFTIISNIQNFEIKLNCFDFNC